MPGAPQTRIYKNRWFAKFASREGISDAMLAAAIDQASRGLIDAELGSGLIKQRVARPGEGKSGGYRTLIFFRMGVRAMFVFGFAKNRQANISKPDLALLRASADEALGWSGEELDQLIASGAWTEIEDDQAE